MTSSSASRWLSAYHSSAQPNARESRISSQQLFLVFSTRRWSWPLKLFACWVFYQLLCLVLMGILDKRTEHGLKWGCVLCFLIDFVPQCFNFPPLWWYNWEHRLMERKGLFGLLTLKAPSHGQLGLVVASGLWWGCISWYKHMAEGNLSFVESGSNEKEESD